MRPIATQLRTPQLTATATAPAGTVRPTAGALRRLTATRPPARFTHAATVIGLAVLVAVAWHERTRAIGARLWGDEAISIGVAMHPLGGLPGLMREDGSPPLYYAVLKFWIALFGGSERAVHALSVTFALLAIPVAWWAGRRLFGTRAAWVAAVLAAFNPLLTEYAQEARMYSLAALLGFLVTTTFVAALVQRRGRCWEVGFAVAMAALLYTHNWGLFVAAASGLAWLGLLAARPRRRTLLVAGLVGFGGALALYAPWLPTLAYQAAHTGAPWLKPPRVAALELAPAKLFASVVGALVAAGLIVAGVAIACARPRRLERPALAAVAALGIGPPVIAWIASQSHPAFTSRYLTLVLGPAILLVAGAAARLGAAAVIAAVVAALVWYPQPGNASITRKTNIPGWAAQVSPRLRAGDTVIAAQPETVPALSFYLRPGLRYVTPLGPVHDPSVVDWRDGERRIDAPAAGRAAAEAVAALKPGTRVVLAVPDTNHGGWGAPWTHRVKVLARRWLRGLEADPQLRRLAPLPAGRAGRRSTIEGVLFARVRA